MTNATKAYKSWLNELKQRIHSSQIKAALKVNAELLVLYWHLGKEILDKEKGYGKKLIDQLSKDLMYEFPQVKGFSRSNLYFVRQWVYFYTQKSPIVQQLVGQLTDSGQSTDIQIDVGANDEIPGLLFKIPWGHHAQIISNCKDYNEALFYVIEATKNNWSRNVLLNQIESNLWQRQGKAITNFEQTLPAAQ